MKLLPHCRAVLRSPEAPVGENDQRLVLCNMLDSGLEVATHEGNNGDQVRRLLDEFRSEKRVDVGQEISQDVERLVVQ